MRGRLLGMLALGLLVATSAHGQRKALSEGDSAPGLDIEEWVQGEETEIQPGNVYVVEFWATWCVPCRKSIPHLSELQEYYEDSGLRIIGVSDEEESTVKKFVRKNRDVMTYTVAVDRRDATKRAWFQAAKLDGIPAAFIVDRKGKIQFIGNPLSQKFSIVLSAVINDRYDAKLFRRAEPLLEAARNARKVRNWRMAFKHYDEVIAVDPKIFADVAGSKFEMMLIDMHDKEAAYKYMRELLVTYADDAILLRDLADLVATDTRVPDADRDFSLAILAAEQASLSFHRNEPAKYAVPAKIHYHAGNYDKAIALQKRAVRVARPNRKGQYQHDLQVFQEAAERSMARSE